MLKLKYVLRNVYMILLRLVFAYIVCQYWSTWCILRVVALTPGQSWSPQRQLATPQNIGSPDQCQKHSKRKDMRTRKYHIRYSILCLCLFMKIYILDSDSICLWAQIYFRTIAVIGAGVSCQSRWCGWIHYDNCVKSCAWDIVSTWNH